ncbi:type IV pilus modification PilV family protein [Limnobacter parvus]|uniref:Prepilin-type N-terminal cleavage/methylation domain-containing protein n=1 Tax=Limnobacter parvus TaxID=2939690 RepID=A0ABT1XHS6_9BURK|nr:prepilin-type N-terminal cleavage/methylation domain-containing protein [Limnobacter parvus]MCR2745832.1 prepilin-type N-terminal cleavage/methylation domain-containing protein [Limnobacter parvus]
MAFKSGGFTFVESLIAISILSIGLLLYAANWTANFGAKSATHARSIAATQVAEIGNVLLANISDLNRTAPRGQVISRVQQFSNQLESHLNGFAGANGYTCDQSAPRVIGTPDTTININNSTLPRAWAQGAASCIKINPMPNIGTDTNGVWVRIEANWIDAHTQQGQSENVSVYTLVSPL